MAEARALSKARAKAAPQLAKAVTQAMQGLGMQGGRFEVALQTTRRSRPQAGLEEIAFLVGGPCRQHAAAGGQGGLRRRAVAHRAGHRRHDQPPGHRADADLRRGRFRRRRRRRRNRGPADEAAGPRPPGAGRHAPAAGGRLRRPSSGRGQAGRGRRAVAEQRVAPCRASSAWPKSRACWAASACRAPHWRTPRKCCRAQQTRGTGQVMTSRSRAHHRHVGLRQVGGAARAGGRRLLLRRQPAARTAAVLRRAGAAAAAPSAWRSRWTCAARLRCRWCRSNCATCGAQGVAVRSLFLDATTDTLVRRFSETRRRHPLSAPAGAQAATGPDQQRALVDAIELERELLADLREQAPRHRHQHDPAVAAAGATSSRCCRRRSAQLTLVFESFAFKRGVPVDADYVFDVRMLPNPHYEPALRDLTGRDAAGDRVPARSTPTWSRCTATSSSSSTTGWSRWRATTAAT